MPQDVKLKKLKELASLVNDGLTKVDFVKAFSELIGHVKRAEQAIMARVDYEVSKIRDGKDGRNGRDGKDGRPGPRGEKGERGPQGVPGFAVFGAKGDPGRDGKDGKDGSSDTGEQIVEKINALPTEDDELKIAIEHIKGLEERLLKAESSGGRQTVIASQRGAVKLYDLSDQLNGVLKTFALPAFWRVIDVKSSSMPNAFRPTVDYTTDGAAMTITFTSQIDEASTLATGQTLLVEYAEL